MTPTRRSAFRILLAALLSSAAGLAAAQAYPTKPVRMICAFGPGVADTGARLVAKWLSEKWGQPVVVENRVGAGGNIAAEAVVKAEPDGYTLLFAARNVVVNVALFDKLPYTPLKDLLPAAIFVNVPFVMVVAPSLPVNNLAELIAYARANPGKLNFGSGGFGTTPHISGELFRMLTKTEMSHIPFKGSADIAREMLGGRIHLAIDAVSNYLQFIERGQIRAIAAAGSRRIDQLPNLPTVAEAGLPEFEAGAWLSVWAPGGISPAILQQVNRDVATVLQSKEHVEQLAKVGLEAPAPKTLPQLNTYMQDEMRKWSEVVRVSGAKVN